jgi:hypothetical protein
LQKKHAKLSAKKKEFVQQKKVPQKPFCKRFLQKKKNRFQKKSNIV